MYVCIYIYICICICIHVSMRDHVHLCSYTYVYVGVHLDANRIMIYSLQLASEYTWHITIHTWVYKYVCKKQCGAHRMDHETSVIIA